ncbi:MAG: hypothetical protein H6734_20130 [Alphaproteobacteria bacterium]|nr:hypothetical protein [Alphaproteobacteria bacterium]
MIWLAAAVAQDACSSTATNLDVAGHAFQAQEAFAALDAEAFATHRDALYAAVPCAGEPLSSATLSGFYLVRALDGFLRRAPEDIRANVAALAEVEPTPPPARVTPRGHPVREAWELAREAGPGPRVGLPVPEGARLRIDGADVLERPVERPTVVQLVQLGGRVGWTRALQPGEAVPAYPEAPEETREAYETATIVFERRRRPVELPVLAGAMLAGAIGTYAASTATHERFQTAPASDLQSIRATNNALVVASAGLASAGLGLGVWTVVTW